MAMKKNPEYMGQDYPYDGELIPAALNEGKKYKIIQANADAATSIMAGCLAYFSAGTQVNDITPTPVDFGDTDLEAGLYLVLPRKGDVRFAYTTDAPYWPSLVPNSSITMSSYQIAAEASCEVVKLEPGMYFWGLIGNDITADVIWNHTYYCIAGGLIGAGGDPDGATIEKKVHAFRAVASFTNMNWALFQYLGKETQDDTP